MQTFKRELVDIRTGKRYTGLSTSRPAGRIAPLRKWEPRVHPNARLKRVQARAAQPAPSRFSLSMVIGPLLVLVGAIGLFATLQDNAAQLGPLLLALAFGDCRLCWRLQDHT